MQWVLGKDCFAAQIYFYLATLLANAGGDTGFGILSLLVAGSKGVQTMRR